MPPEPQARSLPEGPVDLDAQATSPLRPEALAAMGQKFDAVVALEVIEHVEDRAAFLGALAALAKPGGQVFLSTLNRTARSFLMAKVGAEYVLRMLPVGTHDWRMFVTPGELGALLRRAGLGLIKQAFTQGRDRVKAAVEKEGLSGLAAVWLFL